MKYKTGAYQLIKFTSTGSRKQTKTFTSYLDAKAASDKYLTKNKHSSTVITRVIFNSADKKSDKWSHSK